MRLWLPETSAFEPILNRLKTKAAISELRWVLDAIRNVVDYGTNVIPRCWVSSQRSLKDIVALGVLLKQLISLVDAGTELLKEGCVQPAFLQLRAAFEASVYLDWLLQSRSASRAKAYYVWNTRRTVRWLRRALGQSPEARRYRRDLRPYYVPTRWGTPAARRQIRTELRRLQQHLDSRRFRAWNRRFNARRGSRLYDPDWYEVLFTRARSVSFYEICKRVKRRAEYRILYELGSEAMHSSRSDSHVRILEPGKMAIVPLREITDFGFVSQMLMGLALRSYHLILLHYRPAEASNFAKQYLERWQKAFMTRVKIEYNYQHTPIG